MATKKSYKQENQRCIGMRMCTTVKESHIQHPSPLYWIVEGFHCICAHNRVALCTHIPRVQWYIDGQCCTVQVYVEEAIQQHTEC